MNICRICLKSSKTLLYLDNEDLSRKIQLIAPIKILKSDELPKHICGDCKQNVNLLFNFRELIINSDFILRNNCITLINKVTDLKCINAENISNNENESIIIEYIELSQDETEEADIDNVIDIENSDSYLKNGEDESLESNKQGSPPIDNEVLNNYQLKKSQYDCRYCSYTSTDFKSYKSHKSSHGIQKLICSICGKLIRADNMGKHVSTHTELPVACKQCGKVCKNTESLRGHVLIHKGIVMKCKVCDKVYKYRSAYALHVKAHTEGIHKKQKCHLCPKEFRDKNTLKKHIRSHTGERPYPCEFCKKGFSSGNALKTHRRKHTNEKPYKCDYCPKAFPQRVSLRTHLKSKHSTEVNTQNR